MIEVPKILAQEEENAAELCDGRTDILAAIYNEAMKTRQFAHITDIITRPLVQTLESRLQENKACLSQLRKDLQTLKKLGID